MFKRQPPAEPVTRTIVGDNPPPDPPMVHEVVLAARWSVPDVRQWLAPLHQAAPRP